MTRADRARLVTSGRGLNECPIDRNDNKVEFLPDIPQHERFGVVVAVRGGRIRDDEKQRQLSLVVGALVPLDNLGLGVTAEQQLADHVPIGGRMLLRDNAGPVAWQVAGVVFQQVAQ